VLEPTTNNATIAILKSKVVDDGKRRDRIELAGLGFHWPNASLTHSLENTLGYNPLRLGLYSAATGAEDHVGLPDQRKFSPLFPSYRSKLADLLGLRFIATGAAIETMDPKLKPGELPLIARTGDGFIYENPNAYDRVLFATAAQSADFERLLKDGQWPNVDLETTLLLQDAPPAAATRMRPGQATSPATAIPRWWWTPTARMAAGWCSTNVWQSLVVCRGGGHPAELLAPTCCFGPSPCRPAGIRCGSPSGRWPAPSRSCALDSPPACRAYAPFMSPSGAGREIACAGAQRR
jgi:hypothetical protein